MKQIIHTDRAPAAVGPYSQAVEADGFLFLSGQLGRDPATGALADGVEAQARQLLANAREILAAAGMDFSNVLKTTVFLADMKDFAAVNSIYAEAFPADPPARSCFQVAALPAGGLVEMELIAHR